MYANVKDVENILPPTITIGITNLGTPSPGSTSNRDKLTPDEIIYYIRYAQQEIDARLRSMYFCPLRRIKSYEEEIKTLKEHIEQIEEYDNRLKKRIKDENNTNFELERTLEEKNVIIEGLEDTVDNYKKAIRELYRTFDELKSQSLDLY